MRWTWEEIELWKRALYALATTNQPVDYDLYHFCGEWLASLTLDAPEVLA
jgi:hypothetical protein